MSLLDSLKAEAVPRPLALPVHAEALDAVVRTLQADADRGLDSAGAVERGRRYGPNQLAEAPGSPLWRRLLGQFQELVVGILLVAALVAGLMGEWPETLAILAIVVLNGILGFLQEERAGRALAALRRLSAPKARVVRDGSPQSVPAAALVPGDIVELEAGEHVPADLRLVRAFGLRIEEAALTGESTPADKNAECVLPAETPLADRLNMAYTGTVAVAGRGRGVVVATGMATELGRIAGLLETTEHAPTPLQRRLAELGKVLIGACLAAVAVIFALQLLRGAPMLDAVLMGVSLAVAAVPEGLPAVVTVALALGLHRMVRRNALVRKLPSVETLGSVTVICSDKTGTLTRNEMTVRAIVAGDGVYHVTGVGYVPEGQFLTGLEIEEPPRATEAVEPRDELDLIRVLTIGARCNNARVVSRAEGSDWQVEGDPTEGALLIAALKAEVSVPDTDEHVLYEIPFDSERKAMSVVAREPDGSSVMYTKGAPEVVLRMCSAEWRGGQAVPLTDARRTAIVQTSTALAARALRVLGLAERRDWPAGPTLYEEGGLVFAGLIGMIDPPRDEAKDAVQRCRAAGIRPIMITGDHPETAVAIARELGIAAQGENVMSGAALDGTSDSELASIVDRISVYARVTAEHKLRVVKAWRARGDVVAMTGDGVNDAPAVQAADIGIAMGRSGTGVTREASDMVLLDDNFASIVDAVEEGRGIFAGIQKFVYYLLSCNVAEIFVMLFATLVGWPVPLTAIQLLWLNFVTDGLPALALGTEPPEPDVMSQPPRPPREPVITLRQGLLIVVQGLLMAAVTCGAFALVHKTQGLEHARAMALCVLAYAQLFASFGFRSQRYTLPALGFFTNPLLIGAVAVSGLLQLSIMALPSARSVLDLTSHPLRAWATVVLLALVPVTVIETAKLARAALRRRRTMRYLTRS